MRFMMRFVDPVSIWGRVLGLAGIAGFGALWVIYRYGLAEAGLYQVRHGRLIVATALVWLAITVTCKAFLVCGWRSRHLALAATVILIVLGLEVLVLISTDAFAELKPGRLRSPFRPTSRHSAGIPLRLSSSDAGRGPTYGPTAQVPARQQASAAASFPFPRF